VSSVCTSLNCFPKMRASFSNESGLMFRCFRTFRSTSTRSHPDLLPNRTNASATGSNSLC
jgi:hypothetical protein